MRALALVACSLLAAACNADPGADNGRRDQEPPPCPECKVVGAYPPPPYGFSQGSVLGDASFQGLVNAKAESATLQAIKISDFYNPHGRDPNYEPSDPSQDDRLFPATSPYGAQKKPLAMLIDISSLWCGPCKEEAKTVLPGKYATYHPCGGEFFVQLIDGPNPGTPADQANLVAWTSLFGVDYPTTIDPLRQLAPFYNGDMFPDLAIVDTTTMTLAIVVDALPDDAFWHTYESLLDGACLASK